MRINIYTLPTHTPHVTINYLWKVFRIGTVRYNWPMSAHASQAFSIAHCTDSEALPLSFTLLSLSVIVIACETTVYVIYSSTIVHEK